LFSFKLFRGSLLFLRFECLFIFFTFCGNFYRLNLNFFRLFNFFVLSRLLNISNFVFDMKIITWYLLILDNSVIIFFVEILEACSHLNSCLITLIAMLSRWMILFLIFIILFLLLLRKEGLENILIQVFRDFFGSIFFLVVLSNSWVFIDDKVEVVIHCKVVINLLFFFGSLFLFSDFVLELYWARLIISVFSSHSIIIGL